MTIKIIKIIKKWRFKNRNFVYPQCMNVFPKKTATTSGDRGTAYGIHVHCKKCGQIVAYSN